MVGWLAIALKVVLNSHLSRSRDEKESTNAGEHQLLDDVLDNGFTADGQHLLGLAFRQRPQPAPQTGYRNDRHHLAHSHLHAALGLPSWSSEQGDYITGAKFNPFLTCWPTSPE